MGSGRGVEGSRTAVSELRQMVEQLLYFVNLCDFEYCIGHSKTYKSDAGLPCQAPHAILLPTGRLNTSCSSRRRDLAMGKEDSGVGFIEAGIGF